MFKLQYLINYVFNYNCDSGGPVIRIAKSQGSVMRLTIIHDLSRALTSWQLISPKKFGVVWFVSKLDINR